MMRSSHTNMKRKEKSQNVQSANKEQQLTNDNQEEGKYPLPGL